MPSPPVQRLSTGDIVGIVVGCATFTIIIALLVYFCVVRRFRKAVKAVSDYEDKPELETNTPEKDPYIREFHEADGERYLGTELEGKRLPGHEIQGDDHHLVSEMMGSKPISPELDNRLYPSHELSGNDIRHQLGSRREPRYELPAREVSSPSFATRTQDESGGER